MREVKLPGPGPAPGISVVYEYANDDDIIPSRILYVIDDDKNTRVRLDNL